MRVVAQDPHSQIANGKSSVDVYASYIIVELLTARLSK